MPPLLSSIGKLSFRLNNTISIQQVDLTSKPAMHIAFKHILIERIIGKPVQWGNRSYDKHQDISCFVLVAASHPKKRMLV